MLTAAQVRQARAALRHGRSAAPSLEPSRFDRVLSAPLRLAAADEAPTLGPRSFRGAVAVYGNLFYCLDRSRWDVVATVLEPGCFAKSIAEINGRPGDLAGNVPLMYEHWSLLGHTTALEDTPSEVRVTATVTDARELDLYLAWIKDRTVNGMSAGFNVVASIKKVDPAMADGEEVEYVTEATLGEVTACLWGANPLAMIDQVASRSSREAAGKVLSSANEADVNCAVADLARVLMRHAKDAADEATDGAEASALRDQLRIATARIDRQQADLDLLLTLAGLRKG